jgi:diaminobutyrate-2-oxoglutarate transaminase
VLTLAEEIGLGGYHLASRVRKAFHTLPEDELAALMQEVRAASARGHLVYLHEGQAEVVGLFPLPLTALPDQLSYLHFVSLTIQNALKRLPEIYFQDMAVREALRLPPEEEAWLLECWGPSQRESNPIFGRLDAVIDFTSPMWKHSLRFMEPNMSGIGGLNLVPTAERVVSGLVLPRLAERDSDLQLELAPDIRELLMQTIRDHLEIVGRPARNICFVEAKYAGSGIDEQEDLARYFHDQYGLKVMHADPRELSLVRGEIVYEGDAVDLVYRDYAVADLLVLARQGADVAPMRQLFRQNRVVSSIAAELDQKSCWEVLTDPAISQRHFSSDERQIFRRHILWTRIVSDRKTTTPDGRERDLLEYIRHERETLVLKPNRAYGGEGVLIGPAVSQREWEARLDAALADPNRWVVQQLASIPVSEFPVLGPDGRLHSEPFHVVMGFAPTQYGVAILGRASQKQVVNVAQRGGMCVVFVGRHAGRLHGPS